MRRCAAFLRGVNLGTRRRIKNEDLRRVFEELGFEDVATFRASGNVVFRAATGKEGALTTRIEAGLEDSLGFEVSVLLRSDSEVEAIAAHAPFEPRVIAASQGKLQVILLAVKPSATVRKEVLSHATEKDRLALEGRELYWLPSGGTLESNLDQNAIGSALGLATMRTKGTIEQIAAKYFAK
jgi:uncharacterized protein (DUF1697 family)